MLLAWLLASLHVMSAIAWLGGGIIFGFVIGPALESLSPASRGEFMVKVIPKIVRFFQGVAGATVLFGALLLYVLGGSTLLDPGTTYGRFLIVGVVGAAIAFVLSEFIVGPAFMRARSVVMQVQSSGASAPAPELGPAMKRAVGSSLLLLVIMVVTAVCMVGAGFY